MLYQIEKKNNPLSTDLHDGLSDFPHIHSHLELIYMVDGISVASVENKTFLLESGDLFLSFPNQIHFYHDCTPTKGHLFIFAQNLIPDFEKIFRTQVPVSPLIKASLLPSDIRERLDDIHRRNSSEAPYGKIAAKGCLTALLADILPLMPMMEAATDHDSIKNVLTYCSEHYTEPLSLDLLAQELHLNKYYISHIFKERMDLSFSDFVNSLRIEHACSLLEKGASITDIAFASGFSSIRTFNRVFVQTMHMTPRDYIRSKDRQ